MPSRAEGFGLVGLEAMVAGTPAIISRESGLGALLQETLGAEDYERIVTPTSGEDGTNADLWASRIEGELHDRERSFRRAEDVRRVLAEKKSWATAVTEMLSEIRQPPIDSIRPGVGLSRSSGQTAEFG
jgi:glycosyltransferase involved in cell wall biosynthesis